MNEHIGNTVREAKSRQFFAEPDRYLSRNPELFVRAALIDKIVAAERPRRVVDLGCGDGSISLELADRVDHITLVDRSLQMIQRARDNAPDRTSAEIDFVVGDIGEFSSPIPYDLVLCLGVLAHVESVEGVIAKAAELCRAGGRCVFQLTDRQHPLAKALRLYDKIREQLRGRRGGGRGYATAPMSVQDIVEAGRRQGLRCQQVRRYTPALPGTSLLPLRWAQSLQLYMSAPDDETGRGSQALLVFTKGR